MSFSASASVSLLLEMINLSPFFIVKYTFQCPTFSLCAYDPYVYPFWIEILPNVQSAIHLQLFSPWLPERFYSSSISFLHELFKWLEDLLSQPSHYYIKISTYLSDCGFFLCVLFVLIIDKEITRISSFSWHLWKHQRILV